VGATVAEAFVELVPSARGFGNKLESSIRGEMDSAGRSSGSTLGGGIAAGLGRIGPIIGTAAVAGIAGLGALGAAGIAAGVHTAASMEQARISFTTMLGSAQKAGDFLTKLQAFAAKTPFEFPELQTAASSLISVGIDANKVIPIMTSLGNATSGMGTGSEGVRRATVALQQMSAAGRITGEDLNQLRDAGVPVFDLLAAATGKSKEAVAALAQQGKLGKKELDQLFAALESGKGLERFTGLMDKQSQSLSGLFSTFQDTLGQGLAQAVEPLIPLLKDGLAGAADFAAKAMPVLAQGLAAVVTAGMQAASFIQNTIIPAVRSLFEGFQSAGASGTGPIGGFVDFLRSDLIPTLQEVATAVQGYLTVVLPIVQQFVAGMLARLQPLMPQIQSIFATIGEIISASMELIAAVIEQVTTAISFIWTNWGEGIMTLVAAVWSSIIGIIGPALQVIRSIIQTVTAAIHGDWSGVWDGIKGIIDGVFNLIIGIVRGALGILQVLLSGAWSAIKGFTSTAWDQIRQAVVDRVGGLVDFVRSIPGAIVSALGSLGNLLYNAGFNLIFGLIEGIKGAAGQVASAARGVVEGAVKAAQAALGIASPSKVFMKIGGYTAQGMALGIDKGARDVAAAMNRMVSVPSGGSLAFGGDYSGGSLSMDGMTLQVVDVDGALIGSMQTVAGQTVGQLVGARTSAARSGMRR
jgi:tape measure domain-containing protein